MTAKFLNFIFKHLIKINKCLKKYKHRIKMPLIVIIIFSLFIFIIFPALLLIYTHILLNSYPWSTFSNSTIQNLYENIKPLNILESFHSNLLAGLLTTLFAGLVVAIIVNFLEKKWEEEREGNLINELIILSKELEKSNLYDETLEITRKTLEKILDEKSKYGSEYIDSVNTMGNCVYKLQKSKHEIERLTILDELYSHLHNFLESPEEKVYFEELLEKIDNKLNLDNEVKRLIKILETKGTKEENFKHILKDFRIHNNWAEIQIRLSAYKKQQDYLKNSKMILDETQNNFDILQNQPIFKEYERYLSVKDKQFSPLWDFKLEKVRLNKIYGKYYKNLSRNVLFERKEDNFKNALNWSQKGIQELDIIETELNYMQDNLNNKDNTENREKDEFCKKLKKEKINIKVEIAMIHAYMAEYHSMIEDFNQANKNFQTAKKEFNDTKLLIDTEEYPEEFHLYYDNLGIFYRFCFDNELRKKEQTVYNQAVFADKSLKLLNMAILNHETALNMFKGDKSSIFYTRANTNLGIAYTKKLKISNDNDSFENAEKYLNRALDACKNENPIYCARIHRTLGELHWNYMKITQSADIEHIKMAISAYKKALEIFKEEEYEFYFNRTCEHLAAIYHEFETTINENKENLEYIKQELQDSLNICKPVFECGRIKNTENENTPEDKLARLKRVINKKCDKYDENSPECAKNIKNYV